MPVVGFDVNTQRILADGKSWGEVGPYEELLGTLHFATDPLNNHRLQQRCNGLRTGPCRFADHNFFGTERRRRRHTNGTCNKYTEYSFFHFRLL